MISLQKSKYIVHRVTPKELYLGPYEGIRYIEDDLSFLNHKMIQCFLHEKDELVLTEKIKNEFEQLKDKNKSKNINS